MAQRQGTEDIEVRVEMLELEEELNTLEFEFSQTLRLSEEHEDQVENYGNSDICSQELTAVLRALVHTCRTQTGDVSRTQKESVDDQAERNQRMESQIPDISLHTIFSTLLRNKEMFLTDVNTFLYSFLDHCVDPKLSFFLTTLPQVNLDTIWEILPDLYTTELDF